MYLNAATCLTVCCQVSSRGVGQPNGVAQLCLFLADPKKAAFVIGQEFVIDGGVSKKMVYPK